MATNCTDCERKLSNSDDGVACECVMCSFGPALLMCADCWTRMLLDTTEKYKRPCPRIICKAHERYRNAEVRNYYDFRMLKYK